MRFVQCYTGPDYQTHHLILWGNYEAWIVLHKACVVPSSLNLKIMPPIYSSALPKAIWNLMPPRRKQTLRPPCCFAGKSADQTEMDDLTARGWDGEENWNGLIKDVRRDMFRGYLEDSMTMMTSALVSWRGISVELYGATWLFLLHPSLDSKVGFTQPCKIQKHAHFANLINNEMEDKNRSPIWFEWHQLYMIKIKKSLASWTPEVTKVKPTEKLFLSTLMEHHYLASSQHNHSTKCPSSLVYLVADSKE